MDKGVEGRVGRLARGPAPPTPAGQKDLDDELIRNVQERVDTRSRT